MTSILKVSQNFLKATLNNRVFWLVVFFLYLFRLYLEGLGVLSLAEELNIYLLFFLSPAIILLVVIILHTFRKKLWNRLFWQIVFAFVVPLQLIIITLEIKLSFYIFDLLIELLVCLAFYLYAFRDYNIWQDQNARVSQSCFWKGCFYFFVAINIFLLILPLWVEIPELESSPKWLEYSDYSFYLIALLCLYAFSWQQRIFKPRFWQIFFVVHIAYTLVTSVYVITLPNVELPNEPESEITLGETIEFFTYLYWIPVYLSTYIANYLYAFKSKALWQKQTIN